MKRRRFVISAVSVSATKGIFSSSSLSDVQVSHTDGIAVFLGRQRMKGRLTGLESG